MFRHSPSRNQRSKGIKVKHVLQICLLLAVCFWLIYQVKHSHDKKKEFDQNDAKISQSVDEILKFGRKDIHPRVEEIATKNEKRDEEVTEEEETGGEEEEENKHDGVEQQEDHKTEEQETEGRGGGDDEIDEHEQEKSNEVDRDEDFIDEEKEREEGDEKETEEKDIEDKEGQMENENSLEEQDHDGGGRNAHEAREEHYKADDASSAVTQDTQTTSSENENSLENSNENAEINILEQENKVNNTEEIKVGHTTSLKAEDGETAENGTALNATANDEKGDESVSSNSEDGSHSNSTTIAESNVQPEESNNSTEVSTETQNVKEVSTETQNVTVGGSTSGERSDLQIIAMEQANNSNIASDNNHNQTDSNSTVSVEPENAEAIPGDTNSSISSESVVSEKFIRSNTSAETEDSSGSSMTNENTDATQNEKSDTSNGTDHTYKSSGSSLKTENAGEVQYDPIDSSDFSITLQEKDIGTDLDTLPEIRTEGSNSEEVAAE